MRDPWALDPIMTYASWFHYRLDWQAMDRACDSADAVIMNTPRSLEKLKDTFSNLSSQKLFCISNGWDVEDIARLPSRTQKPSSTPMTLVHTGTLHTQTALRVDPSSRKELGLAEYNLGDRIRYRSGKSHLLARTPYYLFRAIRRLLDESRIVQDDIRMIFAGTDTQADRDLAERFDLSEMVEFKGYLSHDESVRQLSLADVLFVPLHVPQNVAYPLIIPGKIYEYMALQKPILALVPQGDARDLLCESGLSVICDPRDVGQIGQAVLSLLQAFHSSGGFRMQARESILRQFDRRRLTKRLAKVFDFAIGS